MNKIKLKKTVSNFFIYLLMAFFLVITLYPILWMVFGSLKEESEFFSNIWGLPKKPQWGNYVEAWRRSGFGQKFLNSVITTGSFLLLLIPVNCCAGYAIARTNFKGKKFIYTFLLLGIMIPAGVLAMPTFTVVNELGLLNKRIGIVLVYVGQAISFGTFIMRNYFVALPKQLEEAAMIDGATSFGAFIRIMLPLAKPGIVTQIIFSGLANWNEYLRASLLIRNPLKQTIPLGMAVFANQDQSINYPVMFAALAMATIPVVIIYLSAQKSFVKGATAGAVKG